MLGVLGGFDGQPHRIEVAGRATGSRSFAQDNVGVALFERLFSRLQASNAGGSDIYLRMQPTNPTADRADQAFPAYALVDDLNAESIQQLADDDHTLAAVVETSPQNYQAWVVLHDDPLPGPVLQAAREILTARYGGDPHAAKKPDQAGRIPGFTNQKPNRATAKGAPFAKLRHMDERGPGPAAAEVLAKARAAVQERRERAPAPRPTPSSGPSSNSASVAARYRRYRDRAARATNDDSRADFRAAADLAREGVPLEQITEALLATRTPDELRAAGHAQPADYAERTARTAHSYVATATPLDPDPEPETPTADS